MLSRRLLILSAVALACASSVHAQDKAESDPSVRLATVGIPIPQGNQVVNYLFLSIRISFTSSANIAKFRNMEPFFRDALIRKAHSVSLAQKDRSDLLDEALFKAVMIPEWTKITGPGQIKSVDILSQSPKRHLG